MPVSFEETKKLKCPICGTVFERTLTFNVSEKSFKELIDRYVPSLGTLLKEIKEFGKIW